MSKAKNFQEKVHWLTICFVLLYKVCSKNVRFCESLASYVCKVVYTSSCTVCCALSDFNKNGNESANLPNRCNIKFNENPFFFWGCYMRTEGQTDMALLAGALLQLSWTNTLVRNLSALPNQMTTDIFL
jgi:hypothetical protein